MELVSSIGMQSPTYCSILMSTLSGTIFVLHW